MKSYDEVASRVFARRAEYEAAQQQKKRVLIHTLAPVCLALLLILGFWQAWLHHKQPDQPVETVNDALYPGIKDYFDELNGESPDHPEANNKIVINSISGASFCRQQYWFHLDMEDYVELSREELTAHYGISVFPTLPEDLKEWDKNSFGIYREDSGTGQVYCDGNALSYRTEDYSRQVNVFFIKTPASFSHYAFCTSGEQKSIVNNLEVDIGITEYGEYYGVFSHYGVCFTVFGVGLTQEEFVSVLSSLIQDP